MQGFNYVPGCYANSPHLHVVFFTLTLGFKSIKTPFWTNGTKVVPMEKDGTRARLCKRLECPHHPHQSFVQLKNYMLLVAVGDGDSFFLHHIESVKSFFLH